MLVMLSIFHNEVWGEIVTKISDIVIWVTLNDVRDLLAKVMPYPQSCCSKNNVIKFVHQ